MAEAVSYIFPIFPVSGQRPETYSVAAQRGLILKTKHLLREKWLDDNFPRKEKSQTSLTPQQLLTLRHFISWEKRLGTVKVFQ